MQGPVFTLGSTLSLDAVEASVIGAFVAQRRRLLETARSLGDHEWAHPTRCSEWDVRELLLHVAGATEACRLTLTGEHEVFGGSFDPNDSPKAHVQSHASQPVRAVLDHFEAAIAETTAAIEAQRSQAPAPTAIAPWGRPVDWRLLVTHFFFDSWIHERDLLLPLGRPTPTSGTEAQLAAAYALTLAAVVSGLFGVPLDATIRLAGTGAATFRILADGADAVISVSPLDDRNALVNGDVTAVTDAISGREPNLAAVLEAPAEVVDALSCAGAFLRG